MIDLTSIDSLGDPLIPELLKSWEVCREILLWVEHLRNNPVQWTTKIEWGQPRMDHIFHPSSITNPCDMYLYMELVGAEKSEKLDGRRLMLFDTGTVVHEQLQYYQHTMARERGHVYVDEYPTWKGSDLARRLHLGGSADGYCEREVMVRYQGKQYLLRLRILFEYKTVNESGFSALRRKPDIGYVRQVHTYMASTDIPVTILLYYNKNNSNMRAFPTLFDYKLWTPIEERLERLVHLADECQLPERNVGGSCSWCKFLEECDPPVNKRKRGRTRLR